jgi:hypothetical protein
MARASGQRGRPRSSAGGGLTLGSLRVYGDLEGKKGKFR